MSPRQLLFLTKKLADIAKEEVGQSMLHILITAISDLLAALPTDPPYPTIAPPPGARQPSLASASAVQAAAASTHLSTDAKIGNQQAYMRHKPSAKEQQDESMHLRHQQEALSIDTKHAKMQATRRKLPAFSKRKELLSQLSQHSVVVISGATGTIAQSLTLATL